MGEFRTVYTSIDNVADALGQDAWTVYHRKFVALIRRRDMGIRSELVSPFGARIQRAAVRFEIADDDVKLLQHDLITLAGEYGLGGVLWDHVKPKILVP